MSTATERKYALTKIAAGDYLLPSNDAQTIWRIARYTDGPSNGLDWPHDSGVWGVWKWNGDGGLGATVDALSWDRWDMHDGLFDTRGDAINAAIGTRCIERSVEGVFTIMRSESSPDCSCCKGDGHIFAYGVDLPGEPLLGGCNGPTVAHPANWLSRVLYPMREQIDGAKVRITITIDA